MTLPKKLLVLLNAGIALLAVSAFAGSGAAQAANFGVEIASRATGKCQTVPNASTVPGTAIIQRICDTQNIRGQHWIFQGQSGTAFRQIFSRDSGLCMRATGFGNGAPVVTGSCGTADAGLFWTITDLITPQPTLRLIRVQSSVMTSVCLDLQNGDIHDGVVLQVWRCDPNTDNQKWNVFVASS